MFEELNKSIKTLAEGHSSIINKLDEHDKRFDMLETAITEVDAKVKGIDARAKKLENGQEEIKQKLDTVTEGHEHRIQKLEVTR